MLSSLLKRSLLGLCFFALTGVLNLAVGQSKDLTVWAPFNGASLQVLQGFADDYGTKHDLAIKLQSFKSQDELLDKWLKDGGNSVDIVVGPHSWAPQLLDAKRIGAYCDGDQCPECFGANPPIWCKFAQGEFEHVVPDIRPNVGLCLPGQCTGCEQASGSSGCWIDLTVSKAKIDAFQSTFSGWTLRPDPMPFPYGIPIGFSFLSAYVNTGVVKTDFGKIRTNTALQELIAEYGAHVATRSGGYYSTVGSLSALEGHGNPEPLYPRPWLQGHGNPEPLLTAGVVFGPASPTFSPSELTKGTLTPLVLDDYQPRVLVFGAYLDSASKSRLQALGFMYELGEADFQMRLFEATGLLPTNAEALTKASEVAVGQGSVKQFVEQLSAGGMLRGSISPAADDR